MGLNVAHFRFENKTVQQNKILRILLEGIVSVWYSATQWSGLVITTADVFKAVVFKARGHFTP